MDHSGKAIVARTIQSAADFSREPLFVPVIMLVATTSLVAIVCWIFYPAYVARRGGDRAKVSEEEICPSPDAASAPMLSIVIPAYNEEKRLPTMLDATLAHLNESRKEIAAQCLDTLDTWYEKGCTRKHVSNSIEILVVSDGSTDATEDIVRSYADSVVQINKSNRLRLLKLQRNSGKGAAVREGLARSRGMMCLMVDADGATEISSGLRKVLDQMKDLFEAREGYTQKDRGSDHPICAVFGSRAHMEEESTASRSMVRTFLMHAFHFFVRCLCSANIRDTQCGFKLFTREAALVLSHNMHLRRWAFDTELVVMMERKGWPIAEVAVTWHEVDGSKIDESKLALALNSIGMLRDMLCVRLCYALKLWTLSDSNDGKLEAEGRRKNDQ